MSAFRAFLFVLGLAAAGGVVAAWDALTGPLPGLSLLYSSEPSKFTGRAPLYDPAPEPDLGAQVRAMAETLHDIGDELAKVRGDAAAARDKANAIDRAHEALAAEFWSLASTLPPTSRTPPAREPRATAKGRRAPPPPACPPEK